MINGLVLRKEREMAGITAEQMEAALWKVARNRGGRLAKMETSPVTARWAWKYREELSRLTSPSQSVDTNQMMTGANLRDLRKIAGLSPGQVGDLGGITVRTVYKWERLKILEQPDHARLAAALMTRIFNRDGYRDTAHAPASVCHGPAASFGENGAPEVDRAPEPVQWAAGPSARELEAVRQLGEARQRLAELEGQRAALLEAAALLAARLSYPEPEGLPDVASLIRKFLRRST